jgi:hypothetical protein
MCMQELMLHICAQAHALQNIIRSTSDCINAILCTQQQALHLS